VVVWETLPLFFSEVPDKINQAFPLSGHATDDRPALQNNL